MQNFEEDDDVFFDTFDTVQTPTDSASSSDDLVEEAQEVEFSKFGSEFLRSDLMSVRERRKRFLCGVGFDEFVPSKLGHSPEPEQQLGLERITESSGAVLNSLLSADDEGHRDSACCIRDLDSGNKFTVHDMGQDGFFSRLKEVGSNKPMTLQEFNSLLGLSRSAQQVMQKEAAPSGEKHFGGVNESAKKSGGWWKRLVAFGMCKNDVAVKNSQVSKVARTKVLRRRKRCFEFTAMYMGQEIRAHRGLIRTMKFSPCGCYMASGGEDCVVRIWQVREEEAPCKKFSADGSSKFVNELREKKLTFGRKGVGAAPVVIPKKVFKIEDTPLHEFHGHISDVLDLSWSHSDCLVTSSMDKTVRMWKVGCNECLRVFQHNDYVTCVQFNPVDNKYFISGSIDGKVRIWGISENHVVDWADIRDIVTAICYRPDGKGFVVGTITGNCRFFDYSGNNAQLETKVCIKGRKKSAGKPITSLQFSPEDSQRIVITSTDAKVRILDGSNVIHKFRGLRRAKSQLSASFTSDGRYIVSVGEDSNVYIWNHNHSRKPSSKSTRSCELFFSKGASVAVPWPGIGRRESSLGNNMLHLPNPPLKILEPSTWLWDRDWCYLGAWFFADGMSRGSATWPEEKLPPSPQANDHRRHDRHYNMHRPYSHLPSLSATWSLVIVTASCDGSIRSFHNYGLPVRLR